MAQPESSEIITNRTVLRGRGQVTLPAQVRLQAGIREGDNLIVTVEDGRIMLTPATLIPSDQAWFWTPEWQAGERQVEVDLAAGHPGHVFDTDEEFLGAIAAAVDDPAVLQ